VSPAIAWLILCLRQKKIAAYSKLWHFHRIVTARFLTDDRGTRVAVVLPVEEFEDLMEDVSDLAAIAERRNEERSSLQEVKQRLISDGILQG
jgi:hypothetical protein